jgi:hypothetical protein
MFLTFYVPEDNCRNACGLPVVTKHIVDAAYEGVW